MSELPDILAELAVAEESLRAQDGDRITRITVGPTLAAWLKRKLPVADAPLAGLLGVPIVEDASFVKGRLRVHRCDAAEDWFAVPAHDPKWLVRIDESVFDIPFPQGPYCTPTDSVNATQ